VEVVMKRASLVSAAIVVLAVLFVGGFAAVAFSEEKTAKDYKDLEGKEWAASDVKYSAPRRGGQVTADLDLRISQIADGKATGTYRVKIKEQDSDDTTQFTSRIATTPDGFPRMDFKTIKGANLEFDLQSNGDFNISGPAFRAVLQRVEETK
jgi:hypothetical protein